MDEPSSGLSPPFGKEVVRVLRETRVRRGDADRREIDHGRIACSGRPAELEADDALREAFFSLH